MSGAAIEPYLLDLARLRIEVFREYPYIYDGTLEYETAYVRTYAESESSLIVLALNNDSVVGASTALPLAQEALAFQAPFIAAGYDVARIFYGGESVLLPAYRGSGVYRQFLRLREEFARESGAFDCLAFCAVERPDDHALRPRDYAPLDPIWQRYGYTKHPELRAMFGWKDVDQAEETMKPMVFWLKSLHTKPKSD